MRLASARDGYSQLFHAVLSTIVEALPPRPTQTIFSTGINSHDRNLNDELVLKNSITLLRFEIQEMQKVLTEANSEYDLSNEAYAQASSALEDVLSLFEERVDDVILDYHIQRPDHSSFTVSEIKFPKLVALSDHIRNCDSHPNGQAQSHPSIENSKLISYGRGASDFRRRASEAQQFNNVMRGIFESLEIDIEAQTTQVFQQHENSPNDDDLARTDIDQAQRLCDTTKALFKLMTENSKQCKASHSVFIHLSGFSKPEIGMIMSVCGEKEKKKWHQVYWVKETSNAALSPSQHESVCSALRQSRKFKNPLRINLQRGGKWTCATPSAVERMKNYSTAPLQTLEELLNSKKEGEPTGSSKKLLKKDKLDLAVEVARSLLYLFGSPLVREPWKPENIYISQTTDELVDSRLRTKSYISRDLNEDFPNHDEEPNHTPAGHSYILYLGTLLWELFFERKVAMTPEDEEDEDEEDQDSSLYNALNREESNSRQSCFVEVPFLDIISNCLNLYSQTELEGLELRKTIYWTIVKPLKALHSYYAPSEEKTPTHAVSHSFSEKPNPSSHATKKLHQSVKKHTVAHAMSFVQKFSSHSSLRMASSSSELLSSQGNITDSSLWLQKFDLVNERLEIIAEAGTKLVKVAVLDTGCNLSAHCFNSAAVRQDERLAGHWFDFLDEDEEPVDDDPNQHGTAMVTLLLRLLPRATAEIYVARVSRDADGLSAAKENIAKAIIHAAETWDVDIISLSLGFSDEVRSIQEAITTAEKIKKHQILFFAAANNDGLNEKEMFPAFSESVISVRGTRHDGSFVQQFNPETWSHKAGTNLYGTISQDIPCDWTSGRLTKSGCSVATPIVAAIAAMIIWYVGSKKESFLGLENVQEIIRTRRGILAVFSVMTEEQRQSSIYHRYLAPWQLFSESDMKDAKTTISYALRKLPPKG